MVSAYHSGLNSPSPRRWGGSPEPVQVLSAACFLPAVHQSSLLTGLENLRSPPSEKAPEAHEVIFHQDGLSKGQWKALNVHPVPLSQFCLLSSDDAAEAGVQELLPLWGLAAPAFSLLAIS